MYLVNFVLDHWVISTLVYLVLMSLPAIRFVKLFTTEGWYKELWLRRRWLRYPLFVSFLIPGYVFALPLLALFIMGDRARKRREEQKQAHEAEESGKAQARRLKIETENQEKASKRKSWFEENKPVLYYNTIDGVTAVLRPADRERVIRDTENARADERWEYTSFIPARETFLFATKPGSALIKKNSNGVRTARWFSELQELCRENNCDLKHDPTIFVPWVNEGVIPFKEQREALDDCGGRSLQIELIDKQAPAELQSLPLR
jgi:hypothetical protein